MSPPIALADFRTTAPDSAGFYARTAPDAWTVARTDGASFTRLVQLAVELGLRRAAAAGRTPVGFDGRAWRCGNGASTTHCLTIDGVWGPALANALYAALGDLGASAAPLRATVAADARGVRRGAPVGADLLRIAAWYLLRTGAAEGGAAFPALAPDDVRLPGVDAGGMLRAPFWLTRATGHDAPRPLDLAPLDGDPPAPGSVVAPPHATTAPVRVATPALVTPRPVPPAPAPRAGAWLAFAVLAALGGVALGRRSTKGR